MTQIHDSNRCDCEMCQFAQNARQTVSSLFGDGEGEKIDSSPASASGIAIPTPDFDHEWQEAPQGMTNYVEHSIAEYWFLRGRRAGELNQMIEENRVFKEMAERRGFETRTRSSLGDCTEYS